MWEEWQLKGSINITFFNKNDFDDRGSLSMAEAIVRKQLQGEGMYSMG